MHRFMAAAMKNAGLKIIEIPVNHRERYAGQSKYTNLDRAIRGIYDLFGVVGCLIEKSPSIFKKLKKTLNLNTNYGTTAIC